ncbi:glycosyltransferase family 4 protein, partial [Helicobacter sp. MIT 14-3879]
MGKSYFKVNIIKIINGYKVKTILITLKDITEEGGGERVVVNLANAFISMGYNVVILSFYKKNQSLFYSLDSRVILIFLSSYSLVNANIFKKFYLKIIYRYFLCFKINKFIRYYKTQVVVANDGWFVPLFKIIGIKYIRIWHLKAPKKKRFNLFFFHTLVILSNKEISLFKKLHPNIKVIPNFIPEIPLEVSNLDNNNVLSVGRMD